jgi:hypothetical protein
MTFWYTACIRGSVDLALREGLIAKSGAGAGSGTVAERWIFAIPDHRSRLFRILDMRHHDTLSTAVENARRVVTVVRGDASDRRDAGAERRKTDLRFFVTRRVT